MKLYWYPTAAKSSARNQSSQPQPRVGNNPCRAGKDPTAATIVAGIEPKDPAHPPVPHPPPHQKTPTTPADRTNPPAPPPHNASAKPAAAATSSSMKPAAGAPSPVHNPRPRPPRSRNGLPHPVITAASAAPLAPVRTPDPARPICDAGTRGRGRDLGRGWSR